jgi:hypothetical protein
MFIEGAASSEDFEGEAQLRRSKRRRVEKSKSEAEESERKIGGQDGKTAEQGSQSLPEQMHANSSFPIS